MASEMLEMVKGKKATFMFYNDGELWYTTECGFEFPIPVSDRAEVGNATFNAEEKAITLMRYIRKHKEYLEKARKESQVR